MSPGGWGQSSLALLGVKGRNQLQLPSPEAYGRCERGNLITLKSLLPLISPFSYFIGSFHPSQLQSQLLRIWCHMVEGEGTSSA